MACELGLVTSPPDAPSSAEARPARLLANDLTLLDDAIEGNVALGNGGESFVPFLEEGLTLLRESGLGRLVRSLRCKSSTELRPVDDEGCAGVAVREVILLLPSDSRSTASSSLASVKSSLSYIILLLQT